MPIAFALADEAKKPLLQSRSELSPSELHSEEEGPEVEPFPPLGRSSTQTVYDNLPLPNLPPWRAHIFLHNQSTTSCQGGNRFIVAECLSLAVRRV